MKVRMVIAPFLVFAFILIGQGSLGSEEDSSSDDHNEESQIWETKNWDADITLSTPGLVTYGDRLLFVMSKSDCSRVGLAFTVYSRQENKDFQNLEGKIIATLLNEEAVGGKVVAAVSFPKMGVNMAFVDLGVYLKDSLLRYFGTQKRVKIQLVDGNNISASDYFDVVRNEWSIHGLETTLGEIQNSCSNVARGRDVEVLE